MPEKFAPLSTDTPSVSLILCVGYGETYYPMALRCALDQDYKGPLEIVIVDNSKEPIDYEHVLNEGDLELEYIRDSTAEMTSFAYMRCERLPVGMLRNMGTECASGEVCITWDEDDWSANNRVTEQVKRLVETGKAVTGWHNIFYYDIADGKTYQYRFEPTGRNHPPYAMGTSQCYLRSWWNGRTQAIAKS